MALNHYDEILQLERDLENLERRYAMLNRLARFNERFWSFFWVAAVGTGLAISAHGFWIADSKVALVPLIVLFVLAGLALALPERNPRVRWIDFVGWFPPGFYGLKFWGLPKWDSIKRSEAEAIEDMIDERKARLAQLKGREL